MGDVGGGFVAVNRDCFALHANSLFNAMNNTYSFNSRNRHLRRRFSRSGGHSIPNSEVEIHLRQLGSTSKNDFSLYVLSNTMPPKSG
jgi:hypothetical protein